MTFDWLIKTEYFVIFRQNSNFWAQVSQDSRSCDKVTLVGPQVIPPVRTAGPVMFHYDCNLFLNAYINHHVQAELCTCSINTNKNAKNYHIPSMCVNTGHNMSPIISLR